MSSLGKSQETNEEVVIAMKAKRGSSFTVEPEE
jgi:hypothetical protein